MKGRRNITVIIVFLLIGAGIMFVQQCKPKEPAGTVAGVANAFVGDQQCKSCHTAEYNAWSGSGHFKAMMEPNDSTVEGDFNDKTYVADGVTSRFFKKDGKFIINTQGDDGNNHDYEVKYTFGYYPLQQYLIEFPGGRMQATRASWDIKNKKWFHQYAGEKIPPHDWLNWTGNGQNWNTMCASCHSTDLQKNYNSETDSYHTTYKVINVSCESCHGAGKLHIDYISSDAYKTGKKIAGSNILIQKNGEQIAQINSCMPCHSRRAVISSKEVTGNEIMNNYIPEIPTTEHYFADGQANDEDYNYTSFLQSQMYRRGVKCSNCHDPHTAKLLFATNQLCTQCHVKTLDDISHTFHKTGSTGAECKNCHMPGKFYMGNDFRYDHTFRVPRPDLSVKYGTPNACNNCHKDKSSQWAADAVIKWYGPTRKYHFAEDLIPGSKTDANSEAHLIKLINDTVPDMVRAASAFYLGSIQSNNSLNTLLNALKQPGANVRYRAIRSLSNFPPEKWITAVGPMLQDNVRAVRIAAAELYISLPANQIPQNFYPAYVNAKAELDGYMMYQADFAIGSMMIGDYYLKQNDYINAAKFYTKSLQKDTSLNYARLNLSVAYNLGQQNQMALEVLLEALKVDPDNDRIYFNLGLLYNEMNNKEDAIKSLKKAVDLKSSNPSVYYNYGLMMQQQGKILVSIDMYNKGLQIAPQDPQLNYALAILYLQTGQDQKAMKPALILKKNDPNNPEYQRIFEYLKI